MKGLSLNCNLKNPDDSLRDQFMCGLSNLEAKKELFKKSELTFNDAYKTAVAQQNADKNAAQTQSKFSNSNSSAAGVLVIRSGNKNNYQDVTAKYKDVTCYCCGKPSRICRYRDYKCHLCHKNGDSKRACKSKEEKKDSRNNSTTSPEERDYAKAMEGDDSSSSNNDDRSSTRLENQDEFFFLKSEYDSKLKLIAEQKCESGYDGMLCMRK